MNSHTSIKLSGILFWTLSASLWLICLVPFNLMPQLKLSFSGHSLPAHHIIFTLTGLLMGIIVGKEIINEKKRWPLFMFLGIALLAGMLLSAVFTTGEKSESIKVIFGLFFRGIIPGWAAYYLSNRFNKENQLIKVIVFIATVVAIGGIYEAITAKFFLFPRTQDAIFPMKDALLAKGVAVSTIGQPLAFSVFLVLLLPLSLAYAQASSSKVSKLHFAIVILGIILAFRRSGWGLLLFITILFPLLSERKLIKTLALFGFEMLLIFLVINFHKPSKATYTHRFDIKQTKKEMQVSHRISSFDVSVLMFAENPITGIGIGQYKHLRPYSEKRNRQIHPDNQYLHVLAEGGLAVFLPLMALILIPVKFLLPYWKDRLCLAYLFSILAFSINIFFADFIYWPAIQMAFFIILGLAMGRVDRLNSLKNQPAV